MLIKDNFVNFGLDDKFIDLINKNQFSKLFLEFINSLDFFKRLIFLLDLIVLDFNEISNLKIENITFIQNIGVFYFDNYFKVLIVNNILIDELIALSDKNNKKSVISLSKNKVKTIMKKNHERFHKNFDFCFSPDKKYCVLSKLLINNSLQNQVFKFTSKKFDLDKTINKKLFNELLKIRSLI
jgi:hypothetical protein